MNNPDFIAMAHQAGFRLKQGDEDKLLPFFESFAFDIGERKLDHCLDMLRKAGYNEAADYLQGVG